MILGIGLGISSKKLQAIDESNSILEKSTFPIDVSRLQSSLAYLASWFDIYLKQAIVKEKSLNEKARPEYTHLTKSKVTGGKGGLWS